MNQRSLASFFKRSSTANGDEQPCSKKPRLTHSSNHTDSNQSAGSTTNPMESTTDVQSSESSTQSSALTSTQSLQTTSQISTTKPKKKRHWLDQWLIEFAWLQRREDADGMVGYCSWCADAKKSNSVALGTTNLQRSTWSRHENHPDHLFCSLTRQPKTQQKTIQQVKEDGSADPSKESQLRTMYFITRNNLPISTFHEMLKLQKLNGCPSLQDDKKFYTSHKSHIEMIDSINDSILDDTMANIHSTAQLGLIIDETTDVTIFKKLCIYIKCLRNNQPVIHFLDCIAVPDGKAETIVQAIETTLSDHQIPPTKLSTLATDGAAVMMGKKGGVGALLRAKHNPSLIQIHCITHRVALAAGQACRDVQYFNDYQLTLKQIFKYFHNSAVRYNELRTLQDLMEDDNIRTLSLKKPASFRWLSLGSAVKAVFNSYPALYTTLENQAAGKDSPEAKGLLLKVKSVAFLLTSAFLVDVLECINKLNLVFQRDNIDISSVTDMVDSTIERLNFFKQADGTTLTDVYNEITNSRYKNLPLTDKQTLRMQFQNSSTQYLDNIVSNLQDRFEPDSLGILQHLNKLLNPANMPADHSILRYGEDLLQSLEDSLSNLQLNYSDLKRNYTELKLLLRKKQTQSLQQTCTDMLNNYADAFPDYMPLFTLLLISPVTSVACERGFSCQNRIKTKARNRLHPEMVAKLMRIQQDGPSMCQYSTTASLEKFVLQRDRRK